MSKSLVSNLKGFGKKLTDRTVLKSLIPFIFLELILLVVPFAIYKGGVWEYQCPSTLVFAPTLILVLFLLVVIPFFILSLSHVNDGLGIKLEFSSHMIILLILFVLYVINLFIPTLLSHERYINTFAILAILISHTITVITPLIRVYIQYRRHGNLVINKQTYYEVIANPLLFSRLKRLMAKELCLENALFIEDFLNLQSLKGCPETSDHKELALSMYENYLKDGSIMQINISYEMRCSIERDLHLQNFKSSVFKEVSIEVDNLVIS